MRKSEKLREEGSCRRRFLIGRGTAVKTKKKESGEEKEGMNLLSRESALRLLRRRRLKTLKVLDFDFVLSGRLVSRFPKLTHVDLVSSCMNPRVNSGILFCHKSISFHLSSDSSNWEFLEENLLHSDVIDRGLSVLGRGSCDLLKLVAINATDLGLTSLAEDCSDIGLTFVAQGCKRLVKLELSGCEGSFDGITAIGQCCEVLDKLTIVDHRMDDGWVALTDLLPSGVQGLGMGLPAMRSKKKEKQKIAKEDHAAEALDKLREQTRETVKGLESLSTKQQPTGSDYS